MEVRSGRLFLVDYYFGKQSPGWLNRTRSLRFNSDNSRHDRTWTSSRVIELGGLREIFESIGIQVHPVDIHTGVSTG